MSISSVDELLRAAGGPLCDTHAATRGIPSDVYDLLAARNGFFAFTSALGSHRAGGPVRPQLGQPHHSAYVVEDIATTVSRLVDQLGAGPFFLIENVPLERRPLAR